MTPVIQPFHLLVIALAGWLNRQQQVVLDYLIEESRVLKEQLGGQRLRFTDKHQGVERLGLRAGGETPICNQVIEKILHFGFAEIPGMAFVVEEDVLTAPIYITL